MPFDDCYKAVRQAEGGWDPAPKDDPGGDTFCGITRNFDKSWAGWAIIDKLLADGVDPSTWTQNTGLMNLVEDFYLDIWHKLGLDQVLTPALQASVFGGVFNDGPRVVGMLQYVLGIPVDDDLGPGTIAAIHAQEQAGRGRDLTNALNLARIQHYATTAKPEYVRGLVLRVFNGA